MTWKYVHASVIGTSHIQGETECQDFSNVKRLKLADNSDVIVAVASDGAGSALYSQQGSKIACLGATKILEKWFNDGYCVEDLNEIHIGTLILTIQRALIKRAAKSGLENAREFAATFLMAIIGSKKSVFVQIGDGAIVKKSANKYNCVFWPMNGEYQNTTYFITDDMALETAQIIFVDDEISDVALFTDGIQMLCLDYKAFGPHQPFFETMFRGLKSNAINVQQLTDGLKNFLASDRVNAKTDDDKSLILISRVDS